MPVITLVCWSCGKKKYMQVSRPPQLGLDLMEIAVAAGWVYAHDMQSVRVFCSEQCIKDQTKENGDLRSRPKKMALKEKK